MVDNLIEAAEDAFEVAYAPISDYYVGAALETVDGSVFTGANVEIANYSNSIHAEEIALSKALMEGHRSFERIVVTSSPCDGITPCGKCRQTLAEFCEPDFEVYVTEDDEIKEYRLQELIPDTIALDTK